MALVIDADVGVKWHVAQPDSEHAEQVLASAEDLHAPDFQYLEIRQVLAKYLRRRLLPEQTVRAAVSSHREMISYWHNHTALADLAFDLALTNAHPFYDCLYLALALRLDARVITADKTFVGRFAAGEHADRVMLLADFAAAA